MYKKWLAGHRSWALGILPVAVAVFFGMTDWAQFREQLMTMTGPLLVFGLVYLGAKALQKGDSQTAWNAALAGNLAAAILVLARVLLVIGLLFCLTPRAPAAELPPGAVEYLPVLQDEIRAHWEAMPMPSVLGAQVEQESHWRIKAHLHTSREDGYGLGQFTVAYRSDGTVRFNAIDEVRRLDPAALADFTLASAYKPNLQLRALTIKNRDAYWHMRRLTSDDYNALALTDAAYNSGAGSVYARQRLCNAVAGCNPVIWFGNIEMHSTQSKIKWHGYGLSAYEITNQHVENVMVKRRAKYVAAMGM